MCALVESHIFLYIWFSSLRCSNYITNQLINGIFIIFSFLSGLFLSVVEVHYDVFLSFRGEDTRNTFVGHLYSALEQEGIFTYKDDETLPRGESIRPSLMKAIEESQIAIIVFSKNYGDSRWCLDELAHIMKCRDTKGQIVMPIFYDVDPSEVRKQKRKYGEAFAKHELEEKTKVESWRRALVDASNISGWEPKHIANRDESKGIKRIVVEISQKLHLVTPSATENLIGMVPRMRRLKSELQLQAGGVRMIGIWGVGGGGKTTLASSIYDEISMHFDGCYFVDNIREETSRYGLRNLQEKILTELDAKRVGGRRLINTSLRHKKVLIVLDDVNQLDQLKVLAGSHDWFGEGSRIVITTRDEHLLNVHRVDVMHNVSLLNNDEANMLFHKHAFRDYRRLEDYEQLTKEVVSYAGGLPLALTVLGSFLVDKNIHEWRSALARLKEIPNDDILETLKISFDGLTKDEKELFLNIACFFRRWMKDMTTEILDACGLHPVIGMKVLIQKALITISEDGEIDMQDLVQEMGHYIVRGQHPQNPEKHSRIWKKEDVLKILAMDATMELDNIEEIQMHFQPTKEQEQYLPLVPANMKNLLYMNLTGNGAAPLLNHFSLRELCYLKLYGGWQKQLWEGCKLLPNLKILKLHHQKNLIKTPDFNGIPNLERFIIEACGCLEEIHPSIGLLEKLVFLSVGDCASLNRLPPMSQLKKLETLKFKGCLKLVKFPKIQQQKMENLPHLDMSKSGGEVASDIQSIPNFFVICWRCGCTNLPGVECCVEEPCLRCNIWLRFFHSMQKLSLRKLDVGGCSLRDEDIGSDVLELPNLQELHLHRNKFSRLNFSHLRLPRLKWLNVSGCAFLVELSDLPSSIAVVIADACMSLKSFKNISKCKWLWKVLLRGSNKVDPLDGETLLNSMLQGNAIDLDHFISITLPHQIPKGFVGRFFTGKTFTKCHQHVECNLNSPSYRLRLPLDWYKDFCGFLIRIVTKSFFSSMNIIMKQEGDEEDSRFEIWQECEEAPELKYDGEVRTHVGYFPFSSLRQTTSVNTSYNIISYWIADTDWTSFATELVPRKSKNDLVQTTKVATDSSEFWDEELDYRGPFTIQHDSKSSVKILWRP